MLLYRAIAGVFNKFDLIFVKKYVVQEFLSKWNFVNMFDFTSLKIIFNIYNEDILIENMWIYRYFFLQPVKVFVRK